MFEMKSFMFSLIRGSLFQGLNSIQSWFTVIPLPADGTNMPHLTVDQYTVLEQEKYL